MPLDFQSHRLEKRGLTERQATIKLGLFKTIDCDVEDLSVSGARIHLPSDEELPKTFTMVLIGTGRKRSHKCMIRWQAENIAGVEFLSTKIG